MNLKTAALFLLCCYSSYANSQSITVSGKITDAHTDEALSFSSVYLKGTTTGSTTDDNGVYSITFSESADTIVFSSMGFNTVKLPLTKQPLQTFNVALDRANFSLVDVVIHAGEDPAITIFKKVQRHKKANDKDKLSSYQYEVYNKLEVDVKDLNPKLTNNRLLRPFNFVYKYMDSTSEEKPYLPMYITESLSNFYSRHSPKATKEKIKASRLAGSANESISQFLGSMYQDVNVYDNRMSLLGVDFISPIAAGGLFYYKYRLVDSAFIEGRYCYKITFNPKHEGQNTFIGDMWINDSTWAIKRVSMTIAKGANINYISKMSLYKDYTPVTDSIWLCKKDKFIVDFISPKKNAPGLIGRKTTSYKNIVANNPMIDTVFKDKVDIETSEEVMHRSEDFWNSVRHDSLSKNEKNIYKLIDTIQQVPAFKTYTQLLTTLGSGYWPVGKVEFGQWYNMFTKNHFEGYRVGFGLQTNKRWNTRMRLTAFGAYGFTDKTFKFDLKGIYILQRKPRIEIRSRYFKDVITYNRLPEELGENNIFSAFSRRVPYYAKLTQAEEFHFSILKEWKTGYSEKIEFTQSQLHPLFDMKQQNGFDGNYETYNNAEVALITRFAYKEKFVTGQFLRSSVGSDYPIVTLDLRQGLKGYLASKHNYQRLRLQISDKIKTGLIGSFYFTIVAEKIWNKDPLPMVLLNVAAGNDTYYNDVYAFNNMNRYEFVTDEYISARLYEYLGGFPFNYIPALKKLKWRTFTGGKFLWGNMSEKNKAMNAYSSNNKINPFEIPARVPYIEVGTGIENIFKVFRIDFVWRLNYLDRTKYLYASPLGVKASLEVAF
jgi:Family of unknown function (DUF5686)/CarboxypepD_reg-like domain